MTTREGECWRNIAAAYEDAMRAAQRLLHAGAAAELVDEELTHGLETGRAIAAEHQS